jgi:formate hydrogenlyase subunit 4
MTVAAVFAWIASVAGWLAVIAAAPLMAGFATWTKARLAGKHGADPLQPYRTMRKLLRKESLAPEASSALFWVGPLLSTSAILLAIIGIPMAAGTPPLPWSDALVIAYLLLVSAMFLVLAGLDTSTAFGGIGASRETMVAALAEPAFMVALLGLTATAGTTNVSTALSAITGGTPSLSRLIIIAALGVLAIAENARLPVDNPATHLELTMIHEAMTLEHSGPQLALIEFGSSLKLALFWLLIVGLLAPPAALGTLGLGGVLAAIALVVAKLAVGGVLLGVAETLFVKMRIFRVPDLLTTAFVLALFGLMVGVAVR